MGQRDRAEELRNSGTQELLNAEGDRDGDGWVDEWVATYPEVDLGEPLADLNGDGLPVYLEMAMGLDPTLDRGDAPAPDPGQELRRLLAKVEQIHADYVRTRENQHRGRRDEEGRPITGAQYLEARRMKASANVERLRREQVEQEAKIERWLKATPEHLRPPGRRPQRIDANGRPLWQSSLTSYQAGQSKSVALWPGHAGAPSGLQINATGAGTTLSLWDNGAPNASHEQLSGVTIANVENLAASTHATAVACILCGSGDANQSLPGALDTTSIQPEAARGMSYGAGLRARGAGDDLATMLSDAGNATVDLRLSVHPYAVDCGWERTLSAEAEWEWFGDLEVSIVEDWKFGAYMTRSKVIDQICHEDPDLLMLPVWAAGNDGANISAAGLLGDAAAINAVPETDSAGPGTVVDHLVNETLFTQTDRPNDNAYATDTLRPESCAKNVLTVNSYATNFNGYAFGPTDDGRMKPDLVTLGGGIGYGLVQGPNESFNASFDVETAFSPGSADYGPVVGTSFAAPVVAGGLAQALDLWQQRRGTSAEAAPWGSTLKALAIAGADKGPNPSSVLPNFTEGWGCFNAHNSALIVHRDTEDDPLQAGALDTETVQAMHRNIKQLELPPEAGSSISFFVERTSDEASFWNFNSLAGFGDTLSVTMCWTDPPSPSVQAYVPGGVSPLDVQDKRLVNDVDLRVFKSDGTELKPFKTEWDAANSQWEITTGDNVRDNVERVVAGSTNGLYEVRITHKGNLLPNDPNNPGAELDLHGGAQKISVVVVGASVAELPVLGNLSICQTTVAGSMCLEWDATLGSLLAVETSTDLETWSEVTQIRASASPVRYDVAPSPTTDRFYRIRLLD